ncbi:MAG: 2-oxo acid dehydrogenase subunit E2 [Homoserinimonas sp.]|nr:2-oxo acid dehydrogenase subunit E2 [Homoserinimonas sp.]MCW5944976.1 2-oxo acid dehydrogenase subunit E2 [Cryobacterium sp.]
MAVVDFALPDLGEGLTESELVTWHVAEGDSVELNQILAEIETAKALVELPSPFAGKIKKLYHPEGTTVLVGAPLIAFEIDGGPDEPAAEDGGQKEERQSVLVGYGPPIDSDKKSTRRAKKGASAPAAAPAAASGSEPEVVAESPRSTPPVRKLARDLGLDLRTISGTGKNGLITREDVEAAFSGAPEHAPSAAPAAAAGLQVAAAPIPRGERETRTRIQGVRKFTAAAMVQSAFTAPHASEFLTIDVTPTMELIAELKGSRQFAGKRINLLTIVAKALCIAVQRNPSVNSRWDEAAQEIIQFNYVNLGIAAATPRGLMVPNIKDADSLDLAGLADALSALVETAKSGASSPAELSGGTISITNIGSFGIDAGTPILNTGEAMILALGAVRRQPWEFNGEIALRQVLTLSVSFDHRLVDGEQGSKFLADVGAILAKPAMLLAMI